MCPQIELHKNVEGSFTGNGQKQGTAQMSINKRIKNTNCDIVINKLVLSTKNQTNDM